MFKVDGEYSVAFQGEAGAFSFLAAQRVLGLRSTLMPFPSFTEVFEALLRHEVDYAVVPIENTLYGSVHENYDHLVRYDTTICGETTLRITHNLITRPGIRLENVKRAFSHPVALDQCRRFFQQHPAVSPEPFYDTAGSVKMLMETTLDDAAAIASETAASMYGGQVVVREIEDNPRNFTRFFLLTKQDGPSLLPEVAVSAWKTSVVFACPNSPGALFKALACFALRDLNLTKLESRPLREQPWEYLFYADISGSTADTRMAKALANLEEICSFYKLLGSYLPTP